MVGGGITGLSLALALGRRRKNVTLVEADECIFWLIPIIDSGFIRSFLPIFQNR
ncbi:FAD-dependent oxidoreductase [Marinobacter sp.]|uniref:FAD-dependent oxidoreductase n=1 Tax=Marinobacter sp. TaxID=50741 RepID=UPI003561807D